MKQILIISLLVILPGCTTVYLNTGSDIDDDKAVIFWVHQDVFTPLRIVRINDKELPHFLVATVKDSPGQKNLYMELEHNYTIEKNSDEYFRLGFEFSIYAKPGYSYNFKLLGADSRYASTSAQLCVYEEPHNTPGSSINFTNEFRVPSASAISVTCSKMIIKNI